MDAFASSPGLGRTVGRQPHGPAALPLPPRRRQQQLRQPSITHILGPTATPQLRKGPSGPAVGAAVNGAAGGRGRGSGAGSGRGAPDTGSRGSYRGHNGSPAYSPAWQPTVGSGGAKGSGGNDWHGYSSRSEPSVKSLEEEIRELERLYGATDRTQSSYRSRQNRLDRQAAAREALYGARHRDADVRLLALRRNLAAAGKLRRRGRFAADDAMPRRSTWHKLAPGLQRTILEERAEALQDAVGLPLPSGRRLYAAAPGLLCDITYGVAARLRALAARLGCGVEGAAAAVAARPLLEELRPELLEACAAEVAVWQGGGLPLGLLTQRLAQEPSLLLEGPRPLIARCQALADALALPRLDALQLMLVQPRLMAVQPEDLPARVAAAQRLLKLAKGAAPAAVPPSLLLCTGAQMRACLDLLLQLLGVPLPAAAALLAAQPALALAAPRALRAAVDFLATALPPPDQMSQVSALGAPHPQPQEHSELMQARLEPPRPQRNQQGQTDSNERARRAEPQPAQQQQRLGLPQQLPPPHVAELVRRCPDVLLLHPRKAAAVLDCLTHVMASAAAPSAMQASDGASGAAAAGATSMSHGRNGTGGRGVWPGRPAARRAGDAPGRAMRPRAGPRDAWQSRSSPRAAGPAPQRCGQASDRPDEAGEAARAAAVAMVHAAPRLLLCRLVPPEAGSVLRVVSARERQTSVLGWVKAVDEAHHKRTIDAASLAADGPDWPRPIVPLPWDLDTDGERPRPNAPANAMCRGGGGGDAAGGATAALLAAAAAVGAASVPIDLGLREEELLRMLAPEPDEAQTSQVHGETASFPNVSTYGYVDRAAALCAEGPHVAMGKVTEGSSRQRALLRQWLWWGVVAAEPRLLLLSTEQLSATATALAAWLAVPPTALAPYLLPPQPAQPELPLIKAFRAEGVQATSLLTQHAALLALTPEALQRAGYRLWAWLGGGAAAAAADVAAVLRALPGLLHDRTTGHAVAHVLWALLYGDGDGGHDGGGGGGGIDGVDAGAAPPAWALVNVCDALDGDGTEVHVMPPGAAALLLRYPSDLLSLALLPSLAPPPSLASPHGAGAAGQNRDAAEEAGQDARVADAARAWSGMGAAACTDMSSGGAARLGWAVERLAALLGVGRLAAAAIVLASRGQVAELAVRLPPAAADSASKAMALVRQGGAWGRELLRYLYGSTSANLPYQYGGGGSAEESLDAVTSSAAELLVVLQEWERVPRLEELDAAGVRDAISYVTALQLPEQDWRELAGRLGLATGNAQGEG